MIGLENDAMDSGLYRGTCSCSDESDHEQYWDIDAAELHRDFNLHQGDDQSSINGSTTRLIRIIALFLLLWASFYSISVSALQHLKKILQYFLLILMSQNTEAAEFRVEFPTSLYVLKKNWYLG